MWECSKCREVIEDQLEVCWNCGTTKEGTEDPDFLRQLEEDPNFNRSAPSSPMPEERKGNGSFEANRVNGVYLLAIVIFAASFMQWGTVVGGPYVPFDLQTEGGLVASKVIDGYIHERKGNPDYFETSLTMTAWNSTIGVSFLRHVDLPNWMPVLAAGGLALVFYITTQSAWTPSAAITVGLPAYAVVHVFFVIASLYQSDDATIHAGIWLTAVALVLMLILVNISPRSPAPKHQH